ncbi:hypothetical protein [Floridanema evergladense]|uniref:Uncharacterized protein n=1 Tax=Floridaenema evergladense BLCC-F167 TaxID=3153639 RepID=A0ABV4WJG8_9CYAN
MYRHSQCINIVSALFVFWLTLLSQTKLSARTTGAAPEGNILRDKDRTINQSQSSPTVNIPLPGPAPQGNILRDDERQINQTQLPWVLVSNQPTQAISVSVTNKISSFLAKEGLTPVSCSTNPVVVISINNKYLACSTPTTKFPPGAYNTNIPDLEPSDK